MRYVAFLLLLLLSLYFFLIKPYLLHNRIHYGIRGLSLQLSPVTLRVKSFYVYFPWKDRRYFLSLENLKVSYLEGINLSLKGGSFISVGGSGKKGGPLKLFIPEFLRELNLTADRFLITYQGERFTSVVLEGVRLLRGRLKGKAKVFREDLTVFISVEEALLLDRSVLIRSMRVWSEAFDLSIAGRLMEGELRGGFGVRGTIGEIRRGVIAVAPVKVEGEGELNYRELQAHLRAYTDKVELEGRGSFRKVRATGKLRLTFGKGLLLEGKVWNESVSGEYHLELFSKRLLKARIVDFPVDSRLLGVQIPIWARVRGDVRLDLSSKDLRLLLSTESLVVENMSFGRSHLSLSYNLQSRSGRADFFATAPGYLRLSGNVGEGGFEGRLLVRELPIVRDGVSTFLSYDGLLSYRGSLFLLGRGKFRDLFFRNLPVGDGTYTVELRDRMLELTYRGEGFEGTLKGHLGRSLISVNGIRELRREVYGAQVEVSEGKVELSLDGKRLTLAVEVDKGSLERSGVRSLLSGRLKVEKDGGISGDYSFELRDINVRGRIVPRLTVTGGIKGDRVYGTYSLEGLLKGKFGLSLSERRLSVKGTFREENLSADYSFDGSPSEGSLEATLHLAVGGRTSELKGEVLYRGERFSLKLEPADYSWGVLDLSFGGLTVEGNLRRADVRFSGAKVSVLNRPVVEVAQEEGSLRLRDGSLFWRGRVSGAVVGEVELRYEGGVEVLSRGTIDLEKLSFFVATPLGGQVRGKLAYGLKYREGKLDLRVVNGGRVVTYSRYFSFPMEAWVDLRALERSLAAFVSVWSGNSELSANVGSLNLRDFYVYLISRELPILYMDEGLLLSIKISSEGWVDVKDLKEVNLRLDALFHGDVEIKRTRAGSGGRERRLPVALDVRFKSDKPIRVVLPEGYVYAKVAGWVGGRAENPSYTVRVELLSGELSYFGRQFFLRGGVLNIVKEKEVERRSVDVVLVNPSEDLNIFLNLRGSFEDPKLVVWSEPPRPTGELLTKLVIGSIAEGILPVAKALFSQLGYVSDLRSGVASLLGVDITFSTQSGAQGELGFSINVKKKIARAFAIEYQQSTLKDPRATYYGASLSLSRSLFLQGRMFSDRSSELKLRFIRKFDF